MRWLVGLMVSVALMGCPARAVTVKDGLGRQVVLAHRPVRIISLTPSVTEILYALQVQDRIVGVTANDHYPPEVVHKLSVGDMRPDYERIIALHPDLVVLEGRLAPTTLEELERLHLPTLALDSATLSGYHSSVRLLGQATATSHQAEALLLDMDRRMAAIDHRVQAVPETQRPRVFIEVWDKPLQTAGSGTFMDELVRRAGGINCFADTNGFPQVNAEQLLVRHPDIVVLTTSTVAAFEERPGLGTLPAVTTGRVYPVNPPDPIVRPSPRLAEGLETLYRFFHPR